ncbi:hypothetical protein [Frankia sp. Cppng1_Ct_nod]|uniref:hypothetical protein n=1 Tax=Frankia sp. Cppng1_Ct_nod TaxID=2897162 RepID=UPI0010419D98|nr:hypothetical protein [Frankia sp. Cppng1_Ct_nod]
MNGNDAQLTAVFTSRSAPSQNVEDNTPNSNPIGVGAPTFEIVVEGVAGSSLATSTYKLSIVIYDEITGDLATLAISPAPETVFGKPAAWTVVGPNYYLEEVFTVTVDNAVAGHVLFARVALISDNFQVVSTRQSNEFVLQAK